METLISRYLARKRASMWMARGRRNRVVEWGAGPEYGVGVIMGSMLRCKAGVADVPEVMTEVTFAR